MKVPPRLVAGDAVAILSPSAGLPSIFPHVYELGLNRLKDVFGLTPIEFPTTRKSISFLAENPKARAEDLNAAFKDPSIKGIIATIGGKDQIEILPYIDQDLIKNNPKIFLGFSDNTNLHLLLWKLGIISYYGGNLMTQFAMQGAMHNYTVESIEKALFQPVIGEVFPSNTWTDEDLPWDDPANLLKTRPLFPNHGWQWHRHEGKFIEGTLWGGCLEILIPHLALKTYLPTKAEFHNTVLFIETSESFPTPDAIRAFFDSLAEIGALQQFQALLVGRPKTQFCGKPPREGKEAYLLAQKQAIEDALQAHACDLLTIFNLDFGHTDPQIILPSGGKIQIHGNEKSIRIC